MPPAATAAATPASFVPVARTTPGVYPLPGPPTGKMTELSSAAHFQVIFG
jgi:hypothetical protein